MRRLINELLLLAQADAAQAIARAPLRLGELVAEAFRRGSPAPGARCCPSGLQIVSPLVIIGDEERPPQNTKPQKNAAKYTPPGTTVNVRLRQAGSVAQLIVADTGPSIAAEHLPHLWDRYYRVDEVRSRRAAGPG